MVNLGEARQRGHRHYMRTADDLFGCPEGTPRTDKLIAASVLFRFCAREDPSKEIVSENVLEDRAAWMIGAKTRKGKCKTGFFPSD